MSFPRTETHAGRKIVVDVAIKPAAHLSGSDTLADGTIILHTSHQLQWFYVQGVRSDGHIVRRRYRHDQMVSVEDWRMAD
jgi:hypothetical protein